MGGWLTAALEIVERQHGSQSIVRVSYDIPNPPCGLIPYGEALAIDVPLGTYL